MKSQARVVVIGGGVMGVGLLYHLVEEGWTDVVLVEKGELTSGSTWHAAGLIPHFNGSLNMAKVHVYASQLYRRLEAESDQATGWHGCGAIRLATNEGRSRLVPPRAGRAALRGRGVPSDRPGRDRSVAPACSTPKACCSAPTRRAMGTPIPPAAPWRWPPSRAGAVPGSRFETGWSTSPGVPAASGTWSPSGGPSSPSTWSTPRAGSLRRWARWSGSESPSSTWSTSIW